MKMKVMVMKLQDVYKILVLSTLIWILSTNLHSQIQPSVYVGAGTCVNLGGIVGVGTEVRHKMFSLNGSVGVLPNRLLSDEGSAKIGYDFGLKFYPIYGFFIGANYGINNVIFESQNGQDITDFECLYGVSFTGGYKWNFYANWFVSAYVGCGISKNSHIRLFPKKTIVDPVIGLFFGYNFKEKTRNAKTH